MKRGNTARRNQHGLSLVELVVVLAIMGVVAGLGATLVGRIASSQQENRGRQTMAQSSDGAMSRLADDLQAALPNSLRLQISGSELWIEWVPVQDAGRYRTAPDTTASGPGDLLDPSSTTDASFDIIGTALAALPAGSQLVLNNRGTPDADVYIGNNRRTGLVLTNAGRNLAFTANGAFAAGNGTARFFVVGTPISLACIANGTTYDLKRYTGYGWRTNQPVGTADLASATAALMMSGLKSCTASYSTALANIGLLNLHLQAGDPDSNATMDFMQQVAIDNTP